jgi:hypothetical protein
MSENYVSVNFEACHVEIVRGVNDMTIPNSGSFDGTDTINGKFIVDMMQESNKES